MKDEDTHEISEILDRWALGKEGALDNLMERVHAELRAIAARQLRREGANPSLQATELVNEAFMKLVQQDGVEWQNRRHFYAIAATAMRRILVDHARRRRADKRGGDMQRVTLEDAQLTVRQDVDLIDLEDCLTRLESLDPQQGKVVELRYFAGCTIEEVAEVLEISPSTVQREWRMARAWLRAELETTGREDT